MAIHFRCSKCGSRLKVPDSAAGQRARCTCGVLIRVPQLAAPAPPASNPLLNELPPVDLELNSSVSPGTLSPAATTLGLPRQPTRTGPSTNRPAVVLWYWIYCGFMSVMHAAFVLLALFLLSIADDLAEKDPKASLEELQLIALPMLVVTALLTVFFAVAPLLGRKPITWTCGTIAIGIGLMSAGCLPAAIPLIIFWLKPATKRYYCVR